MKNVQTKEDVTINKVQSFRSDTEKRLRGYGSKMEGQIEEMHRRFGEEVQAYMEKARAHMKDYMIKSKADCAYFVQQEDPKRFVTSKNKTLV